MPVSKCGYCGAEIKKVRVDREIAKRSFAWKSEAGFYCPKSGDWHQPAVAVRPKC